MHTSILTFLDRDFAPHWPFNQDSLCYTATQLNRLGFWQTYLNLLNAIILNTYMKNVIIKDGSNWYIVFT